MSNDDPSWQHAKALLTPTLEATADILPLLATPRPPRFPPELAAHWQTALETLAQLWAERYTQGTKGLRPAIFTLYAAALDLNDPDCLALAEALANTADHLDNTHPDIDTRLIAALSACLESLCEPQQLEHPLFPERARHFTNRIKQSLHPPPSASNRSPLFDRIFVGDARERTERIHEAFTRLPPDIPAIKQAASELAQLAEPLELKTIIELANQLLRMLTIRAGESIDLDTPATRQAVQQLLDTLDAHITLIANPDTYGHTP